MGPFGVAQVWSVVRNGYVAGTDMVVERTVQVILVYYHTSAAIHQ